MGGIENEDLATSWCYCCLLCGLRFDFDRLPDDSGNGFPGGGQKNNRYLPRQVVHAAAQAIRRAMLKLMDGKGFVDKKSGETVFSYAHPIFWVSFWLVGNGGGGKAGAGD